MILVDYIQCKKYSMFNISVELQDIQFHQRYKNLASDVVTMFWREKL